MRKLGCLSLLALAAFVIVLGVWWNDIYIYQKDYIHLRPIERGGEILFSITHRVFRAVPDRQGFGLAVLLQEGTYLGVFDPAKNEKRLLRQLPGEGGFAADPSGTFVAFTPATGLGMWKIIVWNRRTRAVAAELQQAYRYSIGGDRLVYERKDESSLFIYDLGTGSMSNLLLLLPEDFRYWPNPWYHWPLLSQDGQWLAIDIESRREGIPSVAVVRMSSLEVTVLPGSFSCRAGDRRWQTDPPALLLKERPGALVYRYDPLTKALSPGAEPLLPKLLHTLRDQHFGREIVKWRVFRPFWWTLPKLDQE